MRNILIVGIGRPTGRFSLLISISFACIYFLLFFRTDAFDSVYAGMNFDLDEVLKTLSTLGSNEGLVLTDGKLLSTLFF